MRSNLISLSLAALLSTYSFSTLQAETASFNNNLNISPSIVSPSQRYQLKEGGVVNAALNNADIDISNDDSEDVSAQQFAAGLAAFVAQNPSLVWGFSASNSNIDIDKIGKMNSLELVPSVAYSPSENFTIGAEIHSLSNSIKADGMSSDTANLTFGKLGATFHSGNQWEATAYVSNRAKDGDEYDQAQIIGAHGRYRILDPLALGVSVEHTFYKELSSADDRMSDENKVGLHAEVDVMKDLGLEAAYYNTERSNGVASAHANELSLLGQYAVNSTLTVGAKIDYELIKAEGSKGKTLSESVFIAAKF